MTPVTAVRGPTRAEARPAPREEVPAASECKPAASRALVALSAAGRSDASLTARPQAGFLAHLIATDRQLPQARARRRAEPQDAIAAYGAVDAGEAARAGRTLVRVT
jgi:hypothetical protein